MQFLRNRSPCRKAPLAALLLLAAGSVAAAGQARIVATVTDRDAAPVPQVVVYAEALGVEAERETLPRAGAVMDQKNRQFVPHILVVHTGTAIQFPNSDTVSHHVYSFSPAKAFELALYRQGTVHPPLVFDTPGEVTLGCNIHDDMVGYILVVETPFFALTDGNGAASLAGLTPGRYRIQVWTPRLKRTELPAPVEIEVAQDGPTSFTARFTAKLSPPHYSAESSLRWSRY
jgi:plastocyanin